MWFFEDDFFKNKSNIFSMHRTLQIYKLRREYGVEDKFSFYSYRGFSFQKKIEKNQERKLIGHKLAMLPDNSIKNSREEKKVERRGRRNKKREKKREEYTSLLERKRENRVITRIFSCMCGTCSLLTMW